MEILRKLRMTGLGEHSRMSGRVFENMRQSRLFDELVLLRPLDRERDRAGHGD